MQKSNPTILTKRGFRAHFGDTRKGVRDELQQLAYFIGLNTEEEGRCLSEYPGIFFLIQRLDGFFGTFRCFPDEEPPAQ